ncbi:MAG: ABC transporter substrate-binding protein [Magnetococcales bacterium]|nr:ABC transporter substrate-binding protein [Magnetococcales bacterium]
MRMTDAANAVVLGLMPPLTGLVSLYGREITMAAQMATMEVNENGGVLGRPLRLVIEDDGSLPHSAISAATKLIEHHGCTALIGNLLSNSRIAVAYRVAEPRRVPLLNFSFYEGSILSRYFFHFAALPNQQIGKMIPYMRQKYGPKMFFAGNNYEWPRGSVAAAKEALLLAGGEVAGEEYRPIGVTLETIDALLRQVAESEADVLVPYFAGADQLMLLTRFAALGLKKRMAVVMGHFDEIMASHLPPEVREGCYSTNTYFMSVDTDENRLFLDRLATMPGITGLWPRGNGILTNFGEGAYLCVKAFAMAANHAGTLETEALIGSLESLAVTGPQGTIRMDPITHHAGVNTFLARCRADGQFEIMENFGIMDPIMPERYNHLRIDERAAREEDIRLQARMLEHMMEGVCLVRASDGVIVYTNRGYEKSFNYDAGELIGQHIAVTHAGTGQAADRVVQEIMEHLYRKGSWEGEIENIKKDGTPFWGHISITTLTHAEFGEVWMGMHQDISVRKQTEEELRRYRDNLEEIVRVRTEELERAREAAESGARAKEIFLVNMSHEIRTPMNGVLGIAGLILKTPLTDQQRHYVQIIQRSGRALLRIINDILDFAKIRDGRLFLEVLRFDLDVVIRDVCDIFLQKAVRKGLNFHFDQSYEGKNHLLGDPYRLSQILFNLLGNAIKFTDQGSVGLKMEIFEEREADIVLLFCVTDTGIGISPDYQSQMFQNFSQEDPSVARRFGGTGLGLAITRQLVSLLHGDLWMESKPGHGSTFWFTARFGKQQPGDIQEIAEWNRNQIAVSPENGPFTGRVLLVEDHPVNQEVALATLELFGCQVTVAVNGEQALTLVRETVPTFDIIFMDCEMPILDGFETTRRLRAWEMQSGRAPIPIIALTAHVLQESRQQCSAAGMDDYLHKPFSQADLGAVLRRWLPHDTQLATSGDGGAGLQDITSHEAAQPEAVLGKQGEAAVEVLDSIALGRILDLARNGGNGLLGKMVAHYLAYTPELLATLKQAIEREDAEGVRVAAHTLKSSSLTMGAARLAELGRTLELGHGDSTLVRQSFQQSDALFAEVRQALMALCSAQLPGDFQNEPDR